jgi:hypothetical protein
VAEYVIANAMQPTGRDLFRLTKAVDTLYSSPYLKPLATFQKRIAVANAYGTDFQVPTATAAFLASTNSPHYRVVNKNKETTANFEVLTVETPRTYDESKDFDSDDDSPVQVPLSVLATRLDSLGWQKIFCDVREHLPTVYRRTRQPLSTPQQSCWSSQELLDTICDSDLSLPLGHTVLVANSKSKLYEYLNRGGQPIMDRLASILLQEITSTSTSMTTTTSPVPTSGSE